MAKNLGYEEFKRRMDDMHPTLELLDDGYINSATPMRIRCSVCGFEYYTTWRRLSGNHGCGRCSKVAKLDIEIVRDRFKSLNPTSKILSEEYKNTKTKLHCLCSVCGTEWHRSWDTLAVMPYCPQCHKKESKLNRTPKWTMDEIKEKLSKINPDIEILDDYYINSSSPIKCRCLVCGKIWNSSWNRLQIKGCRDCYFRNNKGEGNPCWKGGLTPLQNHLRATISPWKKDSKAACNYKCVVTGDKFGAIHHLYGFDLIVKETMDVVGFPVREKINEYTKEELKKIEGVCLELHYKYGLGICLDSKIHDKFHSEYGRGGNLPGQFDEFLKKKEMVRIA